MISKIYVIINLRSIIFIFSFKILLIIFQKKFSNKQKQNTSAVGKFLNNHPEITKDQVIQIPKSDFIDEFEAADLEDEILQQYVSNGWKPLNVAKAGSRGGGYNSARKGENPSKEEKEETDYILYTL